MKKKSKKTNKNRTEPVWMSLKAVMLHQPIRMYVALKCSLCLTRTFSVVALLGAMLARSLISTSRSHLRKKLSILTV
jgi:hypothetical protein